MTGGLHGAARHHFCLYCMSWLVTRMEGLDWFVNIRPSMLDEHSWVVPYVETFIAEMLPWASTPAKHSFDTLPDMSGYEQLIKKFAAEGARPA